MSRARLPRGLTLALAACVLAACADTRTQAEAPGMEAADRARVVVRYVGLLALGDSAALTYTVTLHLSSRDTVRLPRVEMVEHLVATSHDAMRHTYSTPIMLSAAINTAADRSLSRLVALGVEDPRFALTWMHLDWAARGSGLEMPADLCPGRAAHLRAVTGHADLALCWPAQFVTNPKANSGT
jgi:hypothetical protein